MIARRDGPVLAAGLRSLPSLGGQGGKESAGETGQSTRPASPQCVQFLIAIDNTLQNPEVNGGAMTIGGVKMDEQQAAFFLSADWSKEARKRSVHMVDVNERHIRYAECGGWNLAELLALAREHAHQGPVLIGIDVAIGLPDCYWRALLHSGRHGRPASFVEWLGRQDPGSDFFRRVRSSSEWRINRPFFHVPKSKGAMKSFEDRLAGGLRRRIEVKTGAKPLFAVSGIPSTVGSATRAFWKELVPLLRAGDRDFAVWPFEGELNDLLRDRRIVLAETYPALAYGAALADKLPTGRMLVSKTRPEQRRAVCERIAHTRWVKSGRVELGDLDPVQADEDAFDSHMTAAAVLRSILDHRPLAAPDWIDPVAEGAMLLAGSVDPALPARRFRMPLSTQAQEPHRTALSRTLSFVGNDVPLPEDTGYFMSYADLEKRHGLVDSIPRECYSHAVHLLREDFEAIWTEVQSWRPNMAERLMLKQTRLMEQIHEVVEQSIKILLKIRGDFVEQSMKRGGDLHHNLWPLFQKLPSLDRFIVEQQFNIYVSLYDQLGRPSLRAYLNDFGDKDTYLNNRLAPVDAVGKTTKQYVDQKRDMHPWIMCEVAKAFMGILEAKAYTDHGLHTIDQRLTFALQDIILHQAYDANVVEMSSPNGMKSAIETMELLVRDRSGWINMAVGLIRGNHIKQDDLMLYKWLESAKTLILSDTESRSMDLDMRLFVARAQREELRWSQQKRRFFTKGPKYEAYTVFPDAEPYTLRWQQKAMYGEVEIRGRVPDWRKPTVLGERISIWLGRNGRKLVSSLSRGESTDFTLMQAGVEKMKFTAMVLGVSYGGWTMGKERELDQLEGAGVGLVVCAPGDTYENMPRIKGDHGKLPNYWIEYREASE